MNKRIRIVARRGDAENAPENTLPAFASAISLGADGVELDIHPTADGHLIVHHFYNLGSSDDGAGLVCERTLSELRSLDAGAWFDPRFRSTRKPMLGEVLEICRGRVSLELDLKGSSLEFLNQVIDAVERYQLIEDVEITSEHSPLLFHAKRINPGIKTGAFFNAPPAYLPVRLAQRHALDWALQLEIDVAHLNLALITSDFVETLHREGLVAYGSNLDTPDQICNGLNCGIDAFSTGHLRSAIEIRDCG